MCFMKDWIRAGEIASQAREFGKQIIRPGFRLLDISEKIEKKIVELDGKCAFPAQLSVNNIAAHYNPIVNDESVLKEGDLVKLDLGVHINGAVADTAVTVDLGNNTKLTNASKEALKSAIEFIKPGVEVREIGRIINKTIEGYGFKSIKNLGGHGIELYRVHTSPFIPNFDNGDNTKLKKGQVIAIEPFATNGAGFVYEGNPSEVYELKAVKPVRNANSRVMLNHINKEYRTLPFAKRWLTNLKGYNLALHLLVKQGIVYSYPQLPEKSKGLVSQHEHTLIVGEKVTTL